MLTSLYDELFAFLDMHQHSDSNHKSMYTAILRDAPAFTSFDSRFKRLIDLQGFPDQEAEIFFFRSVRPLILQGIICYEKMMEIETQRPISHGRELVVYVEHCILELERFRIRNADFIAYLRMNRTDRDAEFFTRAGLAVAPMKFHSIDRVHSTGYDVKLGKWLACNRLITYLESVLAGETAGKNTGDSMNIDRETTDPKWLQSDQVERMLRISASTLKRYRDAGKIPFTRLGGTIFFDENDIHAYLRKHSNKKT